MLPTTDTETSSPEEDCLQTPSSAATIIASNDDLLTEIIVCTPVNSLIRFKSVSKHWFSLISASHFSLLHTMRRPNRRPSGLFLRKAPSIPSSFAKTEYEFVSLSNSNFSGAPFRSLNFADAPSGIQISQSCNGLLLCCTLRKETRNYYIYNPTTKQYSTLPVPHSGAKSSTVFGVNLAFDPLKSIHYKVICVRSTAPSVYCIDEYSSETRSWRSCGDPFTTSHDRVLTDGVFWNSSVHWISPSGASLRFDIDHECLGTMPMIPAVSGDRGPRRDTYFGQANGHLHLIETYGNLTTQFDVFEMERDYSKWFVKYSVDLVGILNAFPEMEQRGCIHYYAYCILSLVREDHEDESSLLVHVPGGKVLSYKFKDNTFKELHNSAPENFYQCLPLQFRSYYAYTYIESLASV
ncbi:F-box protein At5g07610-like [Cornus florida]|uniref:F-box protein At5g07610-like n=1 Tax=Cornus florida TaxID=4283 RepID=UPI00289CAE27|nr:F-box protein At5g07610-like [Cornus florida]